MQTLRKERWAGAHLPIPANPPEARLRCSEHRGKNGALAPQVRPAKSGDGRPPADFGKSAGGTVAVARPPGKKRCPRTAGATSKKRWASAHLPIPAKSAGGTVAVFQTPEQNRRPRTAGAISKTGGGRPPATPGILPHKGTGKAFMLSEKIFNFPLAIFQKYNTIDKKERSQRAERCESANLTFHAYPTVA